MGVIYCYTNKVNQKKYIGQTIDEIGRFKNHKSNAFNPNSSEYESVLHKAFRKYGYENFTYEVLSKDVDDIEILNLLETYYIKKYNSKVPNGYNVEDGGKNCTKNFTLKHRQKLGRSKATLTDEEVIFLRKAYLNKESPTKIYNELYQNKMHFNSFLNIWSGARYSYIMPEVFENNKNRRIKMNLEKAKEIRKLKQEFNLSNRALAEQFKVSPSCIADILNNRTWKE